MPEAGKSHGMRGKGTDGLMLCDIGLAEAALGCVNAFLLLGWVLGGRAVGERMKLCDVLCGEELCLANISRAWGWALRIEF